MATKTDLSVSPHVDAKPEWNAPVVTTIDIKRTLTGAASGTDGTVKTDT